MARQKTVVKLSRPMEVDGEQVSEITIKEPTLGNYRVLDQLQLSGDQAGGFTFGNLGSLAYHGVRELGGLTAEQAGQISLADMMAIAGAVMDFFGVSLPTGKTARQS